MCLKANALEVVCVLNVTRTHCETGIRALWTKLKGRRANERAFGSEQYLKHFDRLCLLCISLALSQPFNIYVSCVLDSEQKSSNNSSAKVSSFFSFI